MKAMPVATGVPRVKDTKNILFVRDIPMTFLAPDV